MLGEVHEDEVPDVPEVIAVFVQLCLMNMEFKGRDKDRGTLRWRRFDLELLVSITSLEEKRMIEKIFQDWH